MGNRKKKPSKAPTTTTAPTQPTANAITKPTQKKNTPQTQKEKKTNTVETQQTFPMSSSIDPVEDQLSEVTLLQTMYSEDFELISKREKSKGWIYRIALTPARSEDNVTHCKVSLLVEYGLLYPNNFPVQMKIERLKGLTDSEIDEMNAIIKKKAQVFDRRPVVFDICLDIQEYLYAHNREELSLHQQMIQNEKAMKEKIELDRKRQIQEEETLKNQQAMEERMKLMSVIDHENERRKLTVKQERQRKRQQKKAAQTSALVGNESAEEDGYIEDDEDEDYDPSQYLQNPVAFDSMAFSSASNFPSRKSAKSDSSPFSLTAKLSSSKSMLRAHDSSDESETDGSDSESSPSSDINSDDSEAYDFIETSDDVMFGQELKSDGDGKVMKCVKKETCEFLIARIVEIQSSISSREVEDITFNMAPNATLSHPQLVSYRGCFVENNNLYIISSFEQGRSVAEILQSTELPEGVVQSYIKQVGQALTYLHSKDVVALCLKATNLIVDGFGQVKLVDYGLYPELSKLLKVTGDQDSWMNRCCYWLAPEVLAGHDVGCHADIWSLGCLAIELLSMVPPFATDLDYKDCILKIRSDSYPIPIPAQASNIASSFILFCMQRKLTSRPNIVAVMEHKFLMQTTSRCFVHIEQADHVDYTMHEAASEDTRKSTPEAKTKHINTDHHEVERRGSGSVSSGLANQNQLRSIPSRYKSDFEELERIGRGGFGSVVKVRNRLDGQLYAIKRIPLRSSVLKHRNSAIFREVTTLSRLQHQHIVRYYQAWVEYDYEERPDSDEESKSSDYESDSEEDEDTDWIVSSSRTDLATDSLQGPSALLSEPNEDHDSGVRLYLYIQMEYCPKNTLRTLISSNRGNEAWCWLIFRQVTEGLLYIHNQRIIHRDLKPDNIFLDEKGDARIGDFGLATRSGKRLRKSQAPSQDSSITAASTSENMTTGVGTPLYASPEQLEDNRHYDGKVDMYALGIILFELLHPMTTASERIQVLCALRRQEFPPSFQDKFPKGHKVISQLINPVPELRPSALEILESGVIPWESVNKHFKEIEKAIRNRDQTFQTWLLDALFQRKPTTEELISYYYHPPSSVNNTIAQIVEAQIKTHMRRIFEKYGYTAYDSNVLGLLDEAKPHPFEVILLDRDGRVVRLPYSMQVAQAQTLAWRMITSIKCFEIGVVYRKNIALSQPKEILECAFSCIQQSSGLEPYLEILSMLSDMLVSFQPFIGTSIITISSTELMEGIRQACGIQPTPWKDLLDHLEKFSHIDINVAKKCMSKAKLSTIEARKLTPFLIFDRALEQLDTIPKGPSSNTRMTQALSKLRELGKLIGEFGLETKVTFSLFSLTSHQLYSDIIFNIRTERGETIAIGGSFNVNKDVYRERVDSSMIGLTRIGCTIALERIVSVVVAKRSELQGSNMNIPGSIDAVVCSFSAKASQQVLSVASMLRQAGFKVDAKYDLEISADQLLSNCKTLNIPWLITVRDRQSGRSHHVHAELIGVSEEDVPLKSLVEYMRSRKNTSLIKKPKSQTVSSEQTASVQSGNSSSVFGRDIIFLHDGSKKSQDQAILDLVRSRLRVVADGSQNPTYITIITPLPIVLAVEISCAVAMSDMDAVEAKCEHNTKWRRQLSALVTTLGDKNNKAPHVVIFSSKDKALALVTMNI
eukprot:TRINITY_DN8474_c0_g1_i2.p1 TRINITY_DN8474_c0_g1~~TRINITY_DN8474_c0_g1_i2.p1  ORF type:complete len:1656 (+),score=312.72 TRINITY_DN8474_c0_g1_i2:46-5013(+)